MKKTISSKNFRFFHSAFSYLASLNSRSFSKFGEFDSQVYRLAYLD